MERIIEAAMRSAIQASEKPLPEAYEAFLRANVTASFAEKIRHTPDHPPYAWMIQSAIRGLNEKAGSTEESISEYIKRENHDLPWAHSTMLKFHLERGCQFGELVRTSASKYKLSTSASAAEASTNSRKKSGKRKRGWQKGRKRHGNNVEDKDLPISEVIDPVEEKLPKQEVNQDTVAPTEFQELILDEPVGDDVIEVPMMPISFVYQRRSAKPEKAASDSLAVVDEDLQKHDYPTKPPTGRRLRERRTGRGEAEEHISGSEVRSEQGVGSRTRGRLRNAAKNYC